MTDTANIVLDPLAHIPAIIAALPDAGEHYYCAGRLYVEGVTQAALEASVAGRDIAAEALNQARHNKLTEINAAAERTMRIQAGLDTYPEFEQKTWPIQQAEAAAWFAVDESDRTADLVPWCAIACAQRGLDLVQFMSKVQAKALAFQALSAAVSGQRQAIEDQIDAAQTWADVQAIEWIEPA